MQATRQYNFSTDWSCVLTEITPQTITVTAQVFLHLNIHTSYFLTKPFCFQHQNRSMSWRTMTWTRSWLTWWLTSVRLRISSLQRKKVSRCQQRPRRLSCQHPKARVPPNTIHWRHQRAPQAAALALLYHSRLLRLQSPQRFVSLWRVSAWLDIVDISATTSEPLYYWALVQNSRSENFNKGFSD